MTWNANLSVGVAMLDEQHKQLIKLVNDLHEAMIQGEAQQVVGTTLNELIRYTQTHFSSEEQLFVRHGYPQTAEHKAEHGILVKRVSELKAKLDAGNAFISVEVSKFLKNWLQHHILETDKKYSPFLNAKGVF